MRVVPPQRRGVADEQLPDGVEGLLHAYSILRLERVILLGYSIAVTGRSRICVWHSSVLPIAERNRFCGIPARNNDFFGGVRVFAG
jgi:hypothetical protein